MTDYFTGCFVTDLGEDVCFCEKCQHHRNPCVYFVQPEGVPVVKVGVTGCLSSRLSMLQTGNHKRLHAVKWISYLDRNDAGAEERVFHDWFNDYRTTGEWFRIDGPVKRFLSRPGGRRCPCNLCTPTGYSYDPGFSNETCRLCKSVVGYELSPLDDLCMTCVERMQSSPIPKVRFAVAALLADA